MSNLEPLQLGKPIKIVYRSADLTMIRVDERDAPALLQRLVDLGLDVRVDEDGSIAAFKNPERLKTCKPPV